MSTLFASILNSSVMLGNYLQQTTSADDIFRCIFFLGALRVKLEYTSKWCISFPFFKQNTSQFNYLQCKDEPSVFSAGMGL